MRPRISKGEGVWRSEEGACGGMEARRGRRLRSRLREVALRLNGPRCCRPATSPASYWNAPIGHEGEPLFRRHLDLTACRQLDELRGYHSRRHNSHHSSRGFRPSALAQPRLRAPRSRHLGKFRLCCQGCRVRVSCCLSTPSMKPREETLDPPRDLSVSRLTLSLEPS